MPLVQVRDVPEHTVRSLRVLAAENGMTLAAYLRRELDRLAARPSNAEIAQRLAQLGRAGGPTAAQTVHEIRRTRETT